MPTILGHAVLGAVIGNTPRKFNVGLLLLCVISAILPDIDVVAFHLGIPYESVWGHRGFTHSLFFAFLWAGLMTLIFPRQKKLVFACVFLSIVSHSLLDAMTSGGLGVALWLPFDDTRFFFSYRPIKVSPLKLKSFFSKALPVLKSEFFWLFIPALLYLLILKIIQRR